MSNETKQAIKQARKQASATTAPKKTTKKTTKTAKTTERVYVHIPRVASFKKSEKRVGFYEAVNKRAKKALKTRKYATKAQLKELDGYFDVKVYTANNVLRTI